MAGVELTAVVGLVGDGACVVAMRFATRAIFLRRAVRRARMLATTVDGPSALLLMMS
jgi:hypothetical protein